MISAALLLFLQTTAGAPAEAEPAAAPAADMPAPAEEAEPQQVKKPRKVCRMVGDPRVSPLLGRRKVCREVFDEDEQG